MTSAVVNAPQRGWHVPHKGSETLIENDVIFFAGKERGFQLIRLPINQNSDEIFLSFTVDLNNMSADHGFYLNIWGNKVGFCILQNGELVHSNNSYVKDLVITPVRKQVFKITFSNSLTHKSISFGILEAKALNTYFGITSNSSFKLSEFSMKILEWAPKLKEPIVYLDVGARGGLNKTFQKLYLRGECRPIFVEPDEKEAKLLRAQYIDSIVLPVALSNINGDGTLNITKIRGCSSLKEPNMKLLSRYSICPAFEVVKKVNIKLNRFDDIYNDKSNPIDIVKIDVQGHEYEVLLGMQNVLNSAIIIELEAHFLPIYHNQKLLSDMIALLELYDFGLCKVPAQMNFDRELLEVNALFLKRDLNFKNDSYKEKYDFLCNLFNINRYLGGENMVKHLL